VGNIPGSDSSGNQNAELDLRTITICGENVACHILVRISGGRFEKHLNSGSWGGFAMDTFCLGDVEKSCLRCNL
jgi:hypothetical protein